MIFMYDYKKLKVWHRAHDLIKVVCGVTDRFPVRENYEIGRQMRRAVESISFNIAEGNSRDSRREYIHYLRIALGSTNEVEAQVKAVNDLGYLEEGEMESLLKELDEIGKMINGVIKFLRKKERDELNL